MGKTIEADKIILSKLFEDFWFLVPEYQRPYVWTKDNVNDLLEDLWFAYENNSDDEYFVGSLVLKRITESSFEEYEVLDGQQRLTTFALMLSCLKQKTNEETTKKAIDDSLYQRAIPVKRIPERIRILYKIRGNSDKFLRDFILNRKTFDDNKDISIKNMNQAIKVINDFFETRIDEIDQFIDFLFNKIIFIYVATKNREDAFRLFTILNDRGFPLTNADILKAINIGEIEQSGNKKDVEDYAKRWEEIQNEFQDGFDRFLEFIRTILIKEKARKNLLEEFEEKIYKKGKLDKGKSTIEFIETYYNVYTKLIDFTSTDNPLPEVSSEEENNEFKNLITIMKTALPSTDWIPPLLHFYKRFNGEKLLRFLKKLEFKFSSDWILYFTPTQRIENMNKILRKIEEVNSSQALLAENEIFNVNLQGLRDALFGDIYGKRFTKYVLLKYEFLQQDNTQFIGNYSLISVEHILPQNPAKDSKWKEWFTDPEIKQYQHKLGNLVLLNRRKNSALSNRDFEDKKEKYFKGSISAFPSINHIMHNQEWKKSDIESRTNDMIKKLTHEPK